MKLIVTGTGRCGTGFMSEVLTEAGMRCTHEGRFNLHPLTTRNDPADSSWLAVPHLYLFRDVPIVLLWRDPQAVIASLLSTLFDHPANGYQRYARQHADLPPDSLNAAAEFWHQWNRKALAANPALVMDITRPDWSALADLSGLDRDALEAAGTTAGRNSRSRGPFSWDDVNPATRDLIDETTEALRRRCGIPAV